MDQLETLPSISRLSENVVRVLGQNPGKFTLQGTNTYIIGKQNPYTLVDTGEGRPEYIPILEAALRETAKSSNAGESDVSDIILSHWHHDHIDGLPAVLSLLRRLWDEQKSSLPYKPPRLHKFPVPLNAPAATSSMNTLPAIINALPPGLYSPSSNGAPFHDLHDSQIMSTGLRIIHTPGHTTDSICIHIPEDRALYTADNVLGQGTAVFEDLAAYLASLRKILDFGGGKPEGETYGVLYPGHGPVVPSGKDIIDTYIKHRLEREAQILRVLQGPPPESAGHWTTWTIVTSMYAAYPQSLWLPAAHSVDLHLRKLEGEGQVRRLGGEREKTSWEVVDILSQPAPPVDS